jgi:hypothetical protein
LWGETQYVRAVEGESDPDDDSTDSEEVGSSASVGKVRRRRGKATQEKLAF